MTPDTQPAPTFWYFGLQPAPYSWIGPTRRTHPVQVRLMLPAWPIWSAGAQAQSTDQTLSAPSPAAGCHMHSPRARLQSGRCHSCIPEGRATLVSQDHTMDCAQQIGSNVMHITVTLRTVQSAITGMAVIGLVWRVSIARHLFCRACAIAACFFFS